MSGSLVQEGSLAAESLNANNGGLSQAGAIAGVTTISGSGKFQMGSLAVGGTDVTATAAELNYLAGADSSINSLSLPAGTIISSYASSSLLNNADEAAFKASVNLEIGTDVQAWDEQLDDIAALAVTDGNIIVGDGTSWVAESGATARTSLGLGTADNVEFANITGATGSFSGNLTVSGDLVVLGSTFSASVGTLLVEDALITIGDGSTSAGNDYGFEFGNNWASFKTANEDLDGSGAQTIFKSSLPISASIVAADGVVANQFYGDGSNLTGISADAASTLVLAGADAGRTGTYSASFSAPLILANTSGGAVTVNLPQIGGSTNWGKILYIKDAGMNAGTNNITINGYSGDDIDGEASILLESDNAAITLIAVSGGVGDSWMIF